MGKIGCSRSWRGKDLRAARMESAEKWPDVSGGTSSIKRVWASFLIWVSVYSMVALSGYWQGEAQADIGNAMWTNGLFSEHIPPRPVHVDLLKRRSLSLLMNKTEPAGLWDQPAKDGWKPCLKHDEHASSPGHSTGYFQVFCHGGLFQLHICVCNAVVVARLLNTRLLIPHFVENPFWSDPSKFQDIYDINHFIAYLKDDVHIVRELPFEYAWSTPQFYHKRCLEQPNCLTFLPKHATKEWYFGNILPVLQSQGIAVIDGFHHKLTFEGLPADITTLRCKTNFYALRFVRPVLDLGQKLVKRMQIKARILQPSPFTVTARAFQHLSMTAHQHVAWDQFGNSSGLKANENIKEQNGHFIGLHLRFEKDMIAHSACYYGGGRAEKQSLASFRHDAWKNRVAKAQFRSEHLRQNGSCPLTPEEVGLLLSGIGFKNSTPIYIAGKGIYGGKARVMPFKEIFPHLENKFSLASAGELKQFVPFSHKLAALDFIVLLNSNVFISNAAGNFPNVLSGYRTFFGPWKSIHPDKAALVSLLSNASITWNDFASRVISVHKNRMGAPFPRKERYSLYRYPAPDCMCHEKRSLNRNS
eukprot:c16391_g1_i1 orf=642-2399(-)